jgi:hypothetical protein
MADDTVDKKRRQREKMRKWRAANPAKLRAIIDRSNKKQRERTRLRQTARRAVLEAKFGRQITTRAEAKASGARRYFTGKPCKHGHIAERYTVSSALCVECINFRHKRAKQTKQVKAAGRPRPSKCEICGNSKKISFDHSHQTGKFRGWLCHRCNCVLGWAHDDPKLLRKLARYLEKHSALVQSSDQAVLFDARLTDGSLV